MAPDLSPGEIAGLDVVEPTSVKRAGVGDVIAIPEGENYRLAVVLARNTWGVALGLYGDSVRTPRTPSASWPIVPYAVHTDDQSIVDGLWNDIGNDIALLTACPQPESYHAPNRASPYPQLHGFGAAETADGRLRANTEEEATRVGLTEGSYEAGYLSEHLQLKLPTLR